MLFLNCESIEIHALIHVLSKMQTTQQEFGEKYVFVSLHISL
jgi:hypothetical protein